jgi:hypothetical protein
MAQGKERRNGAKKPSGIPPAQKQGRALMPLRVLGAKVRSA